MAKGELDEHHGYEKQSKEGHNSRNGSYSKKVKTDSLGDMALNIPLDRKSKFEPQLIPKGSPMSDKLEEDIISIYSRGMTTSDISDHVKVLFMVDVSEGTISNVINQVIEYVMEWQSRPLERVYYAVWMDG